MAFDIFYKDYGESSSWNESNEEETADFLSDTTKRGKVQEVELFTLTIISNGMFRKAWY